MQPVHAYSPRVGPDRFPHCDFRGVDRIDQPGAIDREAGRKSPVAASFRQRRRSRCSNYRYSAILRGASPVGDPARRAGGSPPPAALLRGASAPFPAPPAPPGARRRSRRRYRRPMLIRGRRERRPVARSPRPRPSGRDPRPQCPPLPRRLAPPGRSDQGVLQDRGRQHQGAAGPHSPCQDQRGQARVPRLSAVPPPRAEARETWRDGEQRRRGPCPGRPRPRHAIIFPAIVARPPACDGAAPRSPAPPAPEAARPGAHPPAFAVLLCLHPDSTLCASAPAAQPPLPTPFLDTQRAAGPRPARQRCLPRASRPPPWDGTASPRGGRREAPAPLARAHDALRPAGWAEPAQDSEVCLTPRRDGLSPPCRLGPPLGPTPPG